MHEFQALFFSHFLTYSRKSHAIRCFFCYNWNTLCLIPIFGNRKKKNVVVIINVVEPCSALDKRHGKSYTFWRPYIHPPQFDNGCWSSNRFFRTHFNWLSWYLCALLFWISFQFAFIFRWDSPFFLVKLKQF